MPEWILAAFFVGILVGEYEERKKRRHHRHVRTTAIAIQFGDHI